MSLASLLNDGSFSVRPAAHALPTLPAPPPDGCESAADAAFRDLEVLRAYAATRRAGDDGPTGCSLCDGSRYLVVVPPSWYSPAETAPCSRCIDAFAEATNEHFHNQ